MPLATASAIARVFPYIDSKTTMAFMPTSILLASNLLARAGAGYGLRSRSRRLVDLSRIATATQQLRGIRAEPGYQASHRPLGRKSLASCLWAHDIALIAREGGNMGSGLLRSPVRWLGRRSAVLLLGLTAIGLVAGGLAWLAGAKGAADTFWLIAAAAGLAYALWSAVDSVRHGRLGVDVIALLALAGAVAVREFLAAAVISVMLASGRALEEWAAVGDLLLVASGDVVPVDGTVASAAAVLDESALTGEAQPVEHARGDRLRSG